MRTTNRADLADRYVEVEAGWKTFALEAHHDGDAQEFLREAAHEGAVDATDDAFLVDLRFPEQAEFVVDTLAGRFWSLHTTASRSVAAPLVKHLVESSRDLDVAWLPSGHLRNLWPGSRMRLLRSSFRSSRLLPDSDEYDDVNVEVSGRGAAGWFDRAEATDRRTISYDRAGFRSVDHDLGTVDEVVNRRDELVAKGDSFQFHQEVTRFVVDRYRHLVEAAERRALVWRHLPSGGGTFDGAPITMRFSRPVPDLQLLVDNLFSSRAPFRLWGLPTRLFERFAEVVAVDLHVGQRMHVELAPAWLRVHLYEGGCGNTIARLASNLQHHLDGALSFEDLELNAALRREPLSVVLS